MLGWEGQEGASLRCGIERSKGAEERHGGGIGIMLYGYHDERELLFGEMAILFD